MPKKPGCKACANGKCKTHGGGMGGSKPKRKGY